MSVTLAVLPFVNSSAHEEQEYIADGITDDVINALAKLPKLKVISRTSSFLFKGQNRSAHDIAQELNAQVILEGSVRIAGSRIRIQARLIEAKEDTLYWSENWDRALENIFELQDEISLLIAEKVREQFGHFPIQSHLVQAQTQSWDAYAYSLKAKYYFNLWNPQDVQKAADLFQAALAIDPQHVESHIGLADAYGFLATTEFLPRAETWEKARAHTLKAFELDPQHPGVHYQLANLSFFTDCDFNVAFEHTLTALDHKPGYPEARQFLAMMYTLTRQWDAAEQQLAYALSINPLSPETLFYKGLYHYYAKEYTQAEAIFDQLLAQNPMNIPALVTRAYVLLLTDRADQLLPELKDAQELLPKDEYLGLRTLCALRQKTDSASTYISSLMDRSRDRSAFQAHSYRFLAHIFAQEADAAFDWLEKAIQFRSSVLLITYNSPLVEPIKKDPRFHAFQKALFGSPSNQKQDASSESSELMDAQERQEALAQLLRIMKEEQAFLTPNLSLKDLAERLHLHPNKLSWLLNDSLGKNFNDFLNGYRVEYFKTLAIDPSNAHISILGLAYESGFNSKTVFNTYFKKSEGVTPSQYLRQQ
jgi:TolB-like protein/AraC-like DNA-binding protein